MKTNHILESNEFQKKIRYFQRIYSNQSLFFFSLIICEIMLSYTDNQFSDFDSSRFVFHMLIESHIKKEHQAIMTKINASIHDSESHKKRIFVI